MAPHAALSTADLSEQARRNLLQLLEGIRGKKNLVIERNLANTVNTLVKFSTLQEYGVDKPFFLETGNADSSQRNVIFLCRGEKAKTVYAVSDTIKRLRRNGNIDHEFTIIWAPRRTLVSDSIIEEEGVLGEANLLEWRLYFTPLAEDLISLELEDAFSDLYLRKDPTAIYLSAKALMLIQQRHGLFPRIIGKGDNAKRLADLVIRMRSEVSAGEESSSSNNSLLGLTPSTSIESLIIIDREVDLPTTLLTQLTYEGLLDELFSISANQMEVSSSIVGAAPSSTQNGASGSTAQPAALKRAIRLDQTDSLYQTLRDSNCAVIGPLLNKVARRLQTTGDSKALTNKTTAELKDFVQKLPGFQAEQQSLKLHTSLAEEIIKHTRSEIFSRTLEVQQNVAAGSDPTLMNDNIDELISRAVPLPTILRLLCLSSAVSGGLRQRDLDTFRRTILHAYGHQHLLTFAALEKAGLLTTRSSTGLPGTSSAGAPKPGTVTNFPAARKALHLIIDDVNESDPDDVAYVFSGYAPISIRLVQCILQKSYISSLGRQPGQQANSSSSVAGQQGWRPFDDAVKQIKGATFDELQTGEEKAVRARATLQGGGGKDDAGKTVVVFFLGGVTRAEISALRFVSQKLGDEGKKGRIVIATTGVISGESVVGCAIEKSGFGTAVV